MNSGTAAAATIAGMGMGMMFFIFVLLIVFLIAWITSFVDVIRSEFKNPQDRIIWIVALIFMAPIATILYLIIGKGQKL